LKYIVQPRRRGNRRLHRVLQFTAVVLGFVFSLGSGHILANGYPPPPGPYPFADADNVRPTPRNGQTGAPASTPSHAEFAPVPFESGYSTAVRDPFSADNLFGAAPAAADKPAAKTPGTNPRGMPYEYPAMPYRGDPGVGGPGNVTTKRADFSMDFQRSNRQPDVRPGYGQATAGSPWSHPPAPAGDPQMSAPYPTQAPMGYFPAAATASPYPAGGYADSLSHTDHKATMGPAAGIGDATRQVSAGQATGSAPRPAAPGAVTAEPASPAMWANQARAAPSRDNATGILFRPPAEGE
jgi:hypothetical protein